jgi:hypothetical protein
LTITATAKPATGQRRRKSDIDSGMKGRSDVNGGIAVATTCALAITIDPFCYRFRLKSYRSEPSPYSEDGDVMLDTQKSETRCSPAQFEHAWRSVSIRIRD